MKKIALQKQPIFLLNGEVIWQASDSSLSKELHLPTNVRVIYLRYTYVIHYNCRKEVMKLFLSNQIVVAILSA